MIQVLHISAECYPAAKTGGLADVVGSLPKYLSQAGVLTAAVIPKYALRWIHQREWVTVFGGSVRLDWQQVGFTVQQERGNSLGFPFFVVDIPGFYDRPGIYSDPHTGTPYADETERYLLFQQAVLKWLLAFPPAERPRVLHCHDHHTGLIPFLVKYAPEYRGLSALPTVFTIHNGQYQGWISWSRLHLLPFFDSWAGGMLDWKNLINPMASAIKCAWAVTTVSETYLYELHQNSLGLEQLFRDEWAKEHGIVNGIDADVWDPVTDPMIQHRLGPDGIGAFKWKNKQALCEWFGLPPDRPLISFIGRMVAEKGVDLLPDTYKRFLHDGGQASFLVLGTGEAWTQEQFRAMARDYPGRFNAVIDYNEALSHQIYAGSDFLIMPSRVEPCGLNQMYSMRYGTIPIVRTIGGLKDTVSDIGEPGGGGRGFRFDHFSVDDCYHAIYRAVAMWHNDQGTTAQLRERIMSIDFSWEKTIERYLDIYRRIGARIEPWPAAGAAEDAPFPEMPPPVAEGGSIPAATPPPKAPRRKAAAAGPGANGKPGPTKPGTKIKNKPKL
jgi:starch synthase